MRFTSCWKTEGVTFSAAVPTVWQSLLDYLIATQAKLTTLKRVVIGGAACPEHLIRTFHERFGVEVMHGWGMTEMSPLGSVSVRTRRSLASRSSSRSPGALSRATLARRGHALG